ncbi:hypothetical protein PVK06_034351 [Gossypium arboreum]|uniref:Ribulose-phosphate 3-epimerase n=1 Tax=Gossypium arboreum TaxID=29729 RepID=A0ABR0NDX6_GOSAR|nr:hypothetical protein PVK06_034351 [Gossypium arboreum]
MGVTPKIAPSMLSSDFANLASEAKRMLDFGADWLHMDIMDGYVSLLSWTSLLKDFASLSFYFFSTSCFSHFHSRCFRFYFSCLSIQRWVLIVFFVFVLLTAILLWRHATNLQDTVLPFAENWQELIQKIKSKAMRPGVALKPGTPIEEVYPLVYSENPVEMVLVMTVEPGFGGQKFMPEMVDKVRVLRKKYPALDIEVDGGLGPSTIEMAASAGANCIVAGSSIFGAAEPESTKSSERINPSLPSFPPPTGAPFNFGFSKVNDVVPAPVPILAFNNLGATSIFPHPPLEVPPHGFTFGAGQT